MEAKKFIYWNAEKKAYARIEVSTALNRPAFYAIYEGMKKYHESFGAAYDELARAGYEPNGIIDETGARRHCLPFDDLSDLYRRMEEFIADCTKNEYSENKAALTDVLALIHQRMNTETLK